MIPFPLFEPDKSPFLFTAGDNLINCLPRADGWGPLPLPVEISEALPSECLGAIAIKDPDNVISIYAGTATNLYKLNTSSNPNTWDEISQTTDGYSVPIGDRWSFTRFGDLLIAHNLGGVPQFIDITGSGDFADLAGSPPTAKFSWVAGDFLVFGWLDGEPNTIQWSGLNNPNHWTVGRKSAGTQTFPDGNGISGGIGDERGAIVIQRDKIRYMQFNPSSGYTFTMSVANPYRGTIAPYSIVSIGPGQFAYLSDEGFFSGVEGRAIGAERVDRWFEENVDSSYLFDVRGFADPLEKIAWWRFRNVNGQGRLIGYDWQLDRWCYSDQDNTHAMPSISAGVTWDGLDNLYATIDDVDVPFDSRLFKGGVPTFAMFTSDNKLASLTGGNQAATIQTPFIGLSDERSFVRGARVVTDCTDFTVQTIGQDEHGGTKTTKTAQSPSARSGYVPLRHAARLHSFKVDIPAAANWTIASQIKPDFSPEGMS